MYIQCSTAWSFSTKSKSSSFQTFPLVSGTWDSRRSVLLVKTGVNNSLSSSVFPPLTGSLATFNSGPTFSPVCPLAPYVLVETFIASIHIPYQKLQILFLKGNTQMYTSPGSFAPYTSSMLSFYVSAQSGALCFSMHVSCCLTLFPCFSVCTFLKPGGEHTRSLLPSSIAPQYPIEYITERKSEYSWYSLGKDHESQVFKDMQ